MTLKVKNKYIESETENLISADSDEKSDTQEENYSFISHRISFSEAFRFWVKLGFISFGGPAGQIAVMHRELVEQRRWISEERFLHALNYCMLLPGPEAQQLAVYIGWLLHRVKGGVTAGLFFVLPSIFILLGLSYLYAAYGNIPVIVGVLEGFKPVVAAIVFEAVLKVGRRALKKRRDFFIMASAFIAIYFFQIPFPIIVIAAGLTGFIAARYSIFFSEASTPKESLLDIQAAQSENEKIAEPTIINDTTFSARHIIPSVKRTVLTLIAGLLLWLIPFLLVGIGCGWSSLYVGEYIFFTQAALVTFGGAYAVLGYVTQTLSGSYGWVTHTQAMDGLALAETTPGPLIMVLQFIGFMTIWNHTGGQTGGAVLGALITTYVTFLPSFIFIFVGAPYIESLRGNRNLTGALSGITAAAVGVILQLALVFGKTVIFPQGFSGDVNWFAVFIGAIAFTILFRFKLSAVWVVIGGGLIGLGRNLLFG